MIAGICSPVGDKLIDINDLERYLRENIKVQGKTGNLAAGKLADQPRVIVFVEKSARVIMQVHIIILVYSLAHTRIHTHIHMYDTHACMHTIIHAHTNTHKRTHAYTLTSKCMQRVKTVSVREKKNNP